MASKNYAAISILFGKRETEDDLETKQVLKKHKVTTERFGDSFQGKVELLETKFDQANLRPVKEVDVTKKTLFVGNLSPEAKISDVIDFFKDVSEVFRVVLILDDKGNHKHFGFVEFVSVNGAKKALQKNGEFLLGKSISLAVMNTKNPLRYRYCLYHKVSYHDYLRRENLLIGDDKPVHRLEDVLFVANISPQSNISHIKKFFKDVGDVVSVRLIVNQRGKHVGYGFVEFVSANEAKEALKKNGEYLHDHKIFLQVAAKIALKSPRHKYSLAEMLCYEDYLRSGSLLRAEDDTVECGEAPGYAEVVAARRRTLKVSNLSDQTEISDIIDFFKDVGGVRHVRMIVNYSAKHVGYSFVEFASAKKAKKALQKNGETLLGCEINLDVAEITSHPPPKWHCVDHKVWYEDYLRKKAEKDDQSVGGCDEPPEFAEEVDAVEKSLFVTNFSRQTKMLKIYSKTSIN